MDIHVLSDLHNEFSVFEPHATNAEVVILAGDVGKGNSGVFWAAEKFAGKRILYVPGNHEMYHYQREDTLRVMRNDAEQCGVDILDNDEVIIGGVRFLGATLWTDFELHGADKKDDAMIHGRHGLNDFRLIHEGTNLFTPDRSVILHRESRAWLEKKLAEPFAGKTVVVTHHLPSMLSVADRYKQEFLSACFASNLDHLFGKMDLWVHGHTHDNFDYVANGTRVICNPRGYVTYRGQENFDFDPKLVVEV